MKVNYITLSILLLILLISCFVITYHIRRNNLKTEIEMYNKNLLKLLDEDDLRENFDNHENLLEFSNAVKVKNINVLKSDKNEFKMDLIHIQGEHLQKIKGVFFGDVKGKILKRVKKSETTDPTGPTGPTDPTVENESELMILPPDLAKYSSIMSDDEFRNIEIKLYIEDEEYLDGLIEAQLETQLPGEQKNEVNVDVEFTLNNGDKLINILKTYEDSIRLEIDFSIINKSGKGAFNILFDEEEEYKFKFEFDEENQTLQKKVYYDLKNKINLDNLTIEKLNIKFLPVEQDSDLQFIVTKLNIKFLSDDISSLFPTGLFYRQDRITSGKNLLGTDNKSWKIFIGDRINEDGKESFRKSNDLKKFYETINNSLEITPPQSDPKPNYDVENLKIGIDENDDTQIKINWKIPKTVTDYKYSYLLNLIPKNKDETFKLVNEKISFDKDSYMFSNKNLITGNTYLISLKTIIYEPTTQELGKVEVEYFYKPSGMEDYHTHLFKDGKFDITKLETEDFEKLAETNPQLLQTYFQLLNYNKSKTLDEVGDLQLDIEEISDNTRNKLSKLKCGTMEKNEDILFNGLDEHKENQQFEFEKKQPEQDEKIENIKKKINFLNELKGKKESNVNLKMKSLKSLSDGTILNMEDLGKDKKLVLLNNGCLAFEKNKLFGKSGNFGYVKCNIFNPMQQFRIKKINNIKEYNNLMDLNLEEKITEESEYPFYILQPLNSNKCVHIDNGNLTIENCKETDNIKFEGYFSKSHCNV